LMTGPRYPSDWSEKNAAENASFYDLKGVIEALLDQLHISGAEYDRAEHTTFHPGRSAVLKFKKKQVGVFGELHPQVAAAFDLTDAPVLLAELDLDALLKRINPLFGVQPLPV